MKLLAVEALFEIFVGITAEFRESRAVKVLKSVVGEEILDANMYTWNMSVACVLPVHCVVVGVWLPLLPRLCDCVPLTGPADQVQPGEVGAALLGIDVWLALRQARLPPAWSSLVVPHTLAGLQGGRWQGGGALKSCSGVLCSHQGRGQGLIAKGHWGGGSH